MKKKDVCACPKFATASDHGSGELSMLNLAMVSSRGGGGHFHTWEYWGCAAGQGVFLSFSLWHRVSFLSFRNWDRILF